MAEVRETRGSALTRALAQMNETVALLDACDAHQAAAHVDLARHSLRREIGKDREQRRLLQSTAASQRLASDFLFCNCEAQLETES